MPYIELQLKGQKYRSAYKSVKQNFKVHSHIKLITCHWTLSLSLSLYIYIYIYIYICLCVEGNVCKYEKHRFPGMVTYVYILKLLANIRRFGFYIKPLPGF